MLQKFLTHINNRPKNLFLYDFCGAMVSIFFLLGVLLKFRNFFGIPENVIIPLAILPGLFATLDLFVYFRTEINAKHMLNLIASLNILYLIISLTLVIQHSELIKVPGWIYIILELIIVLIIAVVEIYSARKINTGR